jgi:membrane protein YdbS with pleckstrin-like domain
MQEMEEQPISGGVSPWYLSFAWYIRLMICLASYFFIAYGIILAKITQIVKEVTLVIILLVLTILYIFIVHKDYVRNRKRDLLNNIRKDTH